MRDSACDLPKLGEIRRTRAFFGNFLSLLTKSYSPQAKLEKSVEEKQSFFVRRTKAPPVRAKKIDRKIKFSLKEEIPLADSCRIMYTKA